MIREVVKVVSLIRKGVSAKEGKRRLDIVQQRDEALEQSARDRVVAENEADRRRDLAEYASRLRRKLFEEGLDQAEVEGWPEDRTLTGEEVDRIVRQKFDSEH